MHFKSNATIKTGLFTLDKLGQAIMLSTGNLFWECTELMDGMMTLRIDKTTSQKKDLLPDDEVTLLNEFVQFISRLLNIENYRIHRGKLFLNLAHFIVKR